MIPISGNKEEKESVGKIECIQCRNTFHFSCFNNRKKAILCKGCDDKMKSKNILFIKKFNM